MIDLTKVNRLSDWQKTRKDIEQAIVGVVGKPPTPSIDLQIKTIDEMEFSGYVRRRVNFFVSDWERAAAWVFVPEGKEEWPGILCCHDYTALGKDEPAGIDGDPSLAFARHYAEMGYVTIALDTVTVGERVSAGLEPFDSRRFYRDNPKMSIASKMVADHMRCIDVLAEHRNIDATRVGVIGHGLGGVNALFLCAFDERVQACVSSCGVTSFKEDPDPSRWCPEEGFALMPKLRKAVEAGEYPFDWEHVLALAAPCPTMLVAATNDDQLPKTKSCERMVKRAKSVYKLLGAESALDYLGHDEGRRFSLETLDRADEWFARWL